MLIITKVKAISGDKFTFWLLCAAIVVMSLALFGCGRSPSESDPNESVLYAILPTKITGFDPGNIGDAVTAKVAGQIFECLYQYHYLKRPY